MAKEVKDILQEIAEDTNVDPAVRITAVANLLQIQRQEKHEESIKGMIFDEYGDPPVVSSDLEERFNKLEASVEEVLEVYSNLTTES